MNTPTNPFSTMKSATRRAVMLALMLITASASTCYADALAGGGVTLPPVIEKMSESAAYSLIGDAASLSASTGQSVAVVFHSSLSWPTSGTVSVQSQEIEIVDSNDGVISAVDAPTGYTVEIDADGHSATVSCPGGSNNAQFDVTVHISYSNAGQKLLFAGGLITYVDGTISVAVPSTPIEVGGTQMAPLWAPTEVRPMTAAEMAALNSLLRGGKALSFFKGTTILEVGVNTVGTKTIIGAGVYAVVDGVVYYRTGKSVGPFTALGRVLSNHLPQTLTLPAAPVIKVTPFTREQATQVAKARARRKGTTVCLELRAMKTHYLQKGSAAQAVVNAILIALECEGCNVPPATFGNNPGATRNTDYRKVFQDHYNISTKVLKDYVIHHAVERQALYKEYPNHNILSWAEIQSWQNLRGIPKSINSDVHLSQIRMIWNRFYLTHPNPTKQQLLDQATEIDKMFGNLFDPQLFHCP